MPKFKIYREYGYAEEPDSDIIECETLTEATELSWEWAIERVGSWAEPLRGDDNDLQS